MLTVASWQSESAIIFNNLVQLLQLYILYIHVYAYLYTILVWYPLGLPFQLNKSPLFTMSYTQLRGALVGKIFGPGARALDSFCVNSTSKIRDAYKTEQKLNKI